MIRCRKALDRALACARIAALTFGGNRGLEPSRFLSAQDINDQENDHDDRSDDDETKYDEPRSGEPFARHSLA
jgi:hypothetical protein